MDPRKLLVWRFALLTGLVAGVSCSEPPKVQPAFFHWQTRFDLIPQERAYLDSLHIQRLYFKAFDIDWDDGYGGPVPMATVTGLKDPDFHGELVPAVFLTNRSIERLDDDGVEPLAANMRRKLFSIVDSLPAGAVPEILIDCDWTGGTRDSFFALLDQLRPSFHDRGISLSATIRLHQIRYFERTGVPPVDRGMLMAYNTGNVQAWEEPNSILQPAVLPAYLEDFQRYPLPLDLALPSFGWGVVFREGRLVKLIHGLRSKELENQDAITKTGPGRFELQESMYFKGQYLYRGDRIRCEAPSLEMLEETAGLFRPHFSGREMHLAFYHLDTATLKHYPHEALQRVIDVFASPE